MKNTTFIDERPGADSYCQPPKSHPAFVARNSTRGRGSATELLNLDPKLQSVARPSEPTGKLTPVGVWRAVRSFLRALDKRMTENLDCRARLLMHGDVDEPAKRR